MIISSTIYLDMRFDIFDSVKTLWCEICDTLSLPIVELFASVVFVELKSKR